LAVSLSTYDPRRYAPRLALVGGYDDGYVAEYAGSAGEVEALTVLRARGQAVDTQRQSAAVRERERERGR
jgi:hypothetical protein